LISGLCGGRGGGGLLSSGERVSFLLRGWWWDSPLRKSSQAIPIALQRLVPLAATEQVISLLLELIGLPKSLL